MVVSCGKERGYVVEETPPQKGTSSWGPGPEVSTCACTHRVSMMLLNPFSSHEPHVQVSILQCRSPLELGGFYEFCVKEDADDRLAR